MVNETKVCTAGATNLHEDGCCSLGTTRNAQSDSEQAEPLRRANSEQVVAIVASLLLAATVASARNAGMRQICKLRWMVDQGNKLRATP